MIVDLINKGIQMNKTDYEQNPEYQEWVSNSLSSLKAMFGSHSDEAQEFRKAGSAEGKIAVLRMLRYALENGHKKSSPPSTATVVNVSQTQLTSVHNEMALNIVLNIDHSDDLSDKEKEEVKDLYKEVSEEVQKPNTNWERVRTLLRRSFDYGLKVAPDIVKLADAYFRAKGGK